MMINTMPELPEVETIRRELERVLVGQRIESGEILWPGTIKPLSPKQFLKQIVGQKIRQVERRAKVLLIELGDNHLGIHLKMTGQLVYKPQDSTLKPSKVESLITGGHPQPNLFQHTRAIFTLNDGSKLYFNDLRKFGWLKLWSSETKEAWLARFGREPLSPQFNLKTLATIFQCYPDRQLKQILLDQTLIAGLGNIYVDESCFAARLRPARRLKTLQSSEIKKLHWAVKKILKLAIAKGGTSARDYRRSDGSRGGFVPHLKVYGRGGRPCKICRTPITKIKLAGRGTHFCPRCQR